MMPAPQVLLLALAVVVGVGTLALVVRWLEARPHPRRSNLFEEGPEDGRPSWFVHRVTQLQRLGAGGRLPAGFGVAWHEPDRASAVVARVPFHLALGWAYRRYWRLRLPTAAFADVRYDLYAKGRADARTEDDRYVAQLLDLHRAALVTAERRGNAAGRREYAEALEKMIDTHFRSPAGN